MVKIPVYSINVKEYSVKTKPDHRKLGRKIDVVFKKHFIGKRIVVRCLGSSEHKIKLNELVGIIKKLGTDRYDPKRKGDRYENIKNKQIDFFALQFTVGKKSRIMEKFIEPFYDWPLQPIRIDIASIYDPKKVKRVVHVYPDGRKKKDGYVFKYPEKKKESLMGIIKILE